MKKILLFPIFFFILLFFLAVGYLITIGYETNRFNSILEQKITSNEPNIKVNLDKIKIKLDIKKISFFITTSQPNIEYHNTKIDINKIDAYANLKSLFSGEPKIDKVYISADKTKIGQIQKVVKYFKPSSSKKFFLNNIKKGEISYNLDLTFEDNQIKDYEINGFVKNLYAKLQNINLNNTSFIYSIKSNLGEIDNIRGFVNGFQINSGLINFKNTNNLEINGEIKSELKLDNTNVDNNVFRKKTSIFESFLLNGNINSSFKINFDNTLKIIDYSLKASGNLKNSEFKFKIPQKYIFIKNDIKIINFDKTKFNINLGKDKRNKIDFKGQYKVNNKSLQNINFKNSFTSNNQLITFSVVSDREINIPLINFNTKDKITKIESELKVDKNFIRINKFVLQEGNSRINLDKLIFKKKRLEKFNKITVKTFKNNNLNNDFRIQFGKKITIEGTKYDSSNLTKLLEENNNSDFLKNISKEISVNINEIDTKVSDLISNFSLIGNIINGKFSKIVSKGEFYDNKYLEISLRDDKSKKKKILEIYSDLPKPLLSNYKFFSGLSGGQLLFNSSYDSLVSNSTLTIENFKVKDAPGLVKLLSLADFGGMVDALSGEGLTFEKLEMTFDKNSKILNLKELYAIGPSISILMEGYVEKDSGLISLRGTMIPAKTLNKFLSKLPVVGDILIPKEIGEGLFGISFKMKGTPGKVKTSVNPIKTLTPRFIQKALKKTK